MTHPSQLKHQVFSSSTQRSHTHTRIQTISHCQVGGTQEINPSVHSHSALSAGDEWGSLPAWSLVVAPPLQTLNSSVFHSEVSTAICLPTCFHCQQMFATAGYIILSLRYFYICQTCIKKMLSCYIDGFRVVFECLNVKEKGTSLEDVNR